MQPDYSILLKNNPDLYPSWQQYYNFDVSYPENILNLIKQTTILPYDFYRIVAAYALMPSGLTKRVPYLFFYGVSGSGKSNLAKLIAKIHGVIPFASNATYAAIRNILRDGRKVYVSQPHPSGDPSKPDMGRFIDANTILVWEDIDEGTFKRDRNIYTLFKVGYDKATDTIVISGKEIGTIEKFRCFSHKVFSSIHPIHAIEEYRELRRRLITIPTATIETIANSSDVPLLNMDNINWNGFSGKFNEFWDLSQAEIFLLVRNSLKSLKGLNSQQKAISLDLIATGVSTGIWSDEIEAIQELKNCFEWTNKDVQSETSVLEKLLTELTIEIEKNQQQSIYSNQLKMIITAWTAKGFLLEKPKNKEVIEVMRKLKYKINSKGQWEKI